MSEAIKNRGMAGNLVSFVLFSPGDRNRVATALLSEKPVLMFDEPTSGLDYARMVEVSEVIRSLARHGRMVLVVPHDQEFMQRACDRVLQL